MIVLNIFFILGILVCFAYILRLKWLKFNCRQKIIIYNITAGTTLISQFLGGAVQGGIDATYNALGFILRVNLLIGQVSFGERIISAILISFFILVMFGIFLNWNQKNSDEGK
jgi:hypothetical protein